MTGSIMFFIVVTRPDITYHFAKNPGHQYIQELKTIRQYSKASREWEIIYTGKEKLLVE